VRRTDFVKSDPVKSGAPSGGGPGQSIAYGGQAVIEGVMMRGPKGYAVAVRRPSGEVVACYHEAPMPSTKGRVWSWPFVRGVVSLIDSLAIGIKALVYSANEAMGEDEKISGTEGAAAVALGAALSVGLFVWLPTVIAGPLLRLGATVALVNLSEGLFRLLILVGYVWIIGRMPDIARVFQYHGAEHMVINAYDAGGPYDAETASRFGTAHPRCGTSFLLFVVVVSVAVFSLFGWPSIWVRLATRLALLPVVAGLAYELMKLGARTRYGLGRLLIAPGMLLQKLTTRPPDPLQVEVAARALAELRPPGAEGDWTTAV
jgi:uncharacterized protein YqhQ